MGLGLDTNHGYVDNFSSEWNTVPLYTATDSAGTVFSKVPPTQFPIDAQGRTIFTRDPVAYSASAISDPLTRWIAGNGALPRSFATAATAPLTLTTSDSTFYQQKKALPDLLSTVHLSTFEGGAAYGFAWPAQRGTGHLPTTFREQGDTRVAVAASMGDDGGVALHLLHRYCALATLLLLGLGGLRALAQPASRQNAVVTGLQRGWARGAHFMAKPAHGGLSTLDQGLIVTPPRGLEYGYVPYVVQQSNAF